MAFTSGGTVLYGSALVMGSLSSVLLLHFAQREVGWLPFLASFLTFVLALGTVLLVPYDVWETLSLMEAQEARRALPPQDLVTSTWELIYWAAFLLSWILCPALLEYESSGEFTLVAKLRSSLTRNKVWCAAYAALGVLLLLWLAIGGPGGTSAFCIAAANAWGLLVSVLLLSYGLVAVPKHLWRLASPSEQLASNYGVAVGMDEARLSALFELQDVISEARTEISSRSMQIWDPALEHAFGVLQQTLEESEQLHCELTNGARGPGPDRRQQDCGTVARSSEAPRLEGLAQLHRSVKLAGLEARRAACRWDELVRHCLLLEDLEEQMFPTAVELASGWQSSCGRTLCRLPLVRSFWHGAVLLWLKALRPRVLRVLGVLCAALSGVIVVGQLTMSSNDRVLSLLPLLFTRDRGFGVTQLACLVPMGYIVGIAYWSVFRLKASGWYGLYWNHSTDTNSLLWCAYILSRLVTPLCYHFLALARVENTAYQALLDQMEGVPVLGGALGVTFPILTGCLCLVHLFNLYPRLVQFAGIEALEFERPRQSASGASDLLSEGRRLIERERRRRSEDSRTLLELNDRSEGPRMVPLRVQIQLLIEDGTLPLDWNAHSV